jgi:hypothetical protein
MVKVLDLPSADVAIAFGHTDGGELVRRLYGHRDRDRALDRVAVAYERTASFTQMWLGIDVGIPSQAVDTLLRCVSCVRGRVKATGAPYIVGSATSTRS